ncbi:MAG: hypothetical protein HKN47_16590, partial [Pirellulaceae bacterium]|nr:hypothetical protein [Pirellulaceae bacterium]
MANEIRVLEDQLYDADYQNRVLRDELKRTKEACKPASSSDQVRTPSYRKSVDSYGPSDTANPPMQTGDTVLDSEYDAVPYEPVPTPSEIAPATPADSNPPTAGNQPNADVGEDYELPAPALLSPTPNNNGRPEMLPPSEPEPPGPETFRAPKIEPGELLPPPLPGSESNDVPGKVDLPNELDRLNFSPPTLPPLATPDHIRLHTSLSGGHQFDQDDQIDGLYVVVNVVDQAGKALNLHNFDIDAKMTIVALDPKLDPSISRIGRWEFSPEEVRTFIRSVPIEGLHVPIKWQDNEPISDEVIVHVRLEAQDEEMRCEGTLQLD